LNLKLARKIEVPVKKNGSEVLSIAIME